MRTTFKQASAIIVAAGKGSRMKTNINKQYLLLMDKPVLAHTIDAFEKCDCISEIIVVINKNELDYFHESIIKPNNFSKITEVTQGGEDRQASVFNGLSCVSPLSDMVAVHDGARPLVTPEIIQRSVEVAAVHGVACVGVPVKDTIKKVDASQNVKQTPDRSLLWTIQTPQTFRKEILLDAHQNADISGFRGTDDSVLAERLGYNVRMVMGSYTNIKITTAEDIVFAKSILQNQY
ncbi:MAG: 2-C-methyl-D-erythritol 4-phosphate cytidylyltransferase [Clostridiaceae bacterium]|jgi:2-C-methyl-D-erythritol 4-phosphate cytidylyltransferase|nr:2-C-methyl-D-erythritol 4-phosphate cytidylyltransferase [Clostridiaceae bacterium]